MKTIYYICVVFLIIFFAYIDVPAQKSSARWLFLKPSAEAMALGGTGTGYNLNTFSTYFNPAALTQNRGLNIASSYVNPYPFFPNVTHAFVSFSFNFAQYHTLAVS
jgi:hypothetical protein